MTYSRALTTLLLSASTVAFASTAMAQDSSGDVVIATGIRQSLNNALIEKREADSLVEVIFAEDIGKLPDQNLAEVLENVTGVQITRTEGVGTGVQIRGTGNNLVLFNGALTVGSGTSGASPGTLGNGRGSINFTDVNPAIIAGLEVIKAPEAKHIEGAVGGTINLRTIRPLDLKGPLASVRIQGEDSSLTDGISPRVSGALGNRWENAKGQEIGFVVSGSYTESENTAFRPRLDRDNLVDCTIDNPPSTCPAGVDRFLGVQFLNQVQRTQEFETLNLAGTLEAKPTDNLKIFADVIYTDQNQELSGSRVQASTISRLNGSGDRANGDNTNFTAFDTVNIGTVEGENGDQDFGSIGIVTQGTFTPLQEEFGTDGRGAPFLRSQSDGNTRDTDTTSVRLGGEWEATEALTVSAEFARSSSFSENANLAVNLNFINPNSFLSPSGDDFRDENGTPFIFDLTDGFGFDINFDDPFAPSEADLLDPNNYVIDGNPQLTSNLTEDVDRAFRFDGSYDFSETGLSSFIDSVDAGVRFGTRTSSRDNRAAAISGSSSLSGSLNAGGISQLLSEVPDNFASGTGNALAVDGVLQVDPNLTRNTLSAVNTINTAAVAQGLSPIFGELTSTVGAFFETEEDTVAIYGQANFDFGRIRGNAGLRYIDTDISSTANVLDGDGGATLTTIDNGYDHFLPRVNVAVDVTEDIILRASYTEDINRASFAASAAVRTFPNSGGVNGVSVGGNPDLVPEEIENLDANIDWYFAPEAILSVGVFRKTRSGLIAASVDPAAEVNGLRDVIGPDCEGGGIFSPGTSPGIFGDEAVTGLGVCVGNQSSFNTDNSTEQTGVEVALQYNLGAWEDRLGSFDWASGFGFTANYTYQDEDNNIGFTPVTGNRNITILAAQGFTAPTREIQPLPGLSNHAYNLTGFYEKFGISARLRYTWRDAFVTQNLPGTSALLTPFGFSGIQESRGQLNGSLSYEVIDGLTLQVDAVNLTESSSDVFCAEDGGLLCYQGITDRRVIFGASYTF